MICSEFGWVGAIGLGGGSVIMAWRTGVAVCWPKRLRGASAGLCMDGHSGNV